jgi:hypothetical protein
MDLEKFDTSKIEVKISSAGLDLATLIIIIVCGVLGVIILVIGVFLCVRKKKQKIQEEDEKQKVEIEAKQEKNLAEMKQFIKVPNPEEKSFEEDNIKKEQDNTNYGEKSTTDRKLLNDRSNNTVDINTKDIFQLNIENEIKKSEASELEASFRVDLYKLDTKQDKLKDLIDSNLNNPNKRGSVYQYEEHKNVEKTSKDLAADNINIYSEGNRGDFYSEAGDEPEPDLEHELEYYHSNSNQYQSYPKKNHEENKKYMDHDDEFKDHNNIFSMVMKNDKNAAKSNLTKATDATKATSNNHKDMEQEMSPDEFNNDDEDYYEYSQYIKNLNENKKPIQQSGHGAEDNKLSNNINSNSINNKPAKRKSL